MHRVAQPRVGIYLRVSTADQSCALQRRELKQYAAARGWHKITFYEDLSFTGTNGNRPALKQLLADARQRKIDVVLCWKMDRLFRSLKDLVTLLQEFQELGISFVSLKDQVDLSTSAGRLMMQVIGAFGEFEASLIRERVRAGLQNAKAKGRVLGRPKKRDDSAIQSLRHEGLSLRKIAYQLKISVGSVQRALRSSAIRKNRSMSDQLSI